MLTADVGDKKQRAKPLISVIKSSGRIVLYGSIFVENWIPFYGPKIPCGVSSLIVSGGSIFRWCCVEHPKENLDFHEICQYCIRCVAGSHGTINMSQWLFAFSHRLFWVSQIVSQKLKWWRSKTIIETNEILRIRIFWSSNPEEFLMIHKDYKLFRIACFESKSSSQMAKCWRTQNGTKTYEILAKRHLIQWNY